MTPMLRCLFAALILALMPLSAMAQAPLKPLLDEAMGDGAIPAMAVVVIRDGKVVDQAVAGVRVAGGGDPALLTDGWHLGSNGKSMTATLIARLVERGVLRWDAPLSALLPDVAMNPAFRNMTLADLLAHRAGLRDLDDTADAALLERAWTDSRPLSEQRLDFARTVLAEAPIGPARGESVYSNSGSVLAAVVAERATGKAFETLMQEEVFGPLGMIVDYRPSRPGDLLGHEGGKGVSGPRADNPPLFHPVGEVRMGMGDWAIYAIDQMAGEQGRGKLLKADSYRFLHAAQGDTDTALGWGVRTSWPKAAPVRMLMHAGSNGRWYALIALVPDQQDGVLIVANTAEGEVGGTETQILLTLMTDLVSQP